MQLWICK